MVIKQGGFMKKFGLFLILFMAPAICFAISGYPQKATVVNKTLTTAGVEYRIDLPNGTGGFTIQSRTASDFKVGSESNQSGTTYYTVKSGTVYSTPTPLGMGPVTPNTTIFLQSASAGQVIEMIYFQ